MNTKTGEIKSYPNDVAIENMTPLTQREFEALRGVEEKDRPRVLALFRFIEERKLVGASCDIRIKNAFSMGYRAALKDQK
jgi:hypothetical protein